MSYESSMRSTPCERMFPKLRHNIFASIKIPVVASVIFPFHSEESTEHWAQTMAIGDIFRLFLVVSFMAFVMHSDNVHISSCNILLMCSYIQTQKKILNCIWINDLLWTKKLMKLTVQIYFFLSTCSSQNLWSKYTRELFCKMTLDFMFHSFEFFFLKP